MGEHVLISVENLIDELGGVNGTGWLSGATVNVYGGFATPALLSLSTCGHPCLGLVRPQTSCRRADDNSVRAVYPSLSPRRQTLESYRHNSSDPSP
jgi:hypothetical protein